MTFFHSISKLDGLNTIYNAVTSIYTGVIQVPEFMSNKFTWGEREILNLFDNIYSGIYRMNILVISPYKNFRYERTDEWTIPSEKLSRDIPQK